MKQHPDLCGAFFVLFDHCWDICYLICYLTLLKPAKLCFGIYLFLLFFVAYGFISVSWIVFTGFMKSAASCGLRCYHL